MRKQSEKAPAPFFNIGASSLLVIFLILCLVTFAILTLTSAKSDADFAEKQTGCIIVTLIFHMNPIPFP